MGDIVRHDGGAVEFSFSIASGAPIERVELRDHMQVLETVRPYTEADLGRRIRILWEGSEYRGRGRQTIWNGKATLNDNRFERADPINFWNIDKKLEPVGETELRWQAITTGGFGGADVSLAHASTGTLTIDTTLVKAQLPVSEIGLEDTVLDSGAGIKRRMRVFRLPEVNPHRSLEFSRRLALEAGREHAIYVCVTFEDGHLAWSSPIYLVP
jgi:hypothetical protein